MAEHECLKEREIDDLKKEIDTLKSLQYTDHELLIRIETKFDIMSDVIKTLADEIKILTNIPAKRFAEFKMAVYVGSAVAFVTVVIPFLIKSWINGGL